ncbi:MAG: hypothetical protein CME62_15910 [Halobacteriovoraceae bacterium]|nr:hypothetical protein [Halobacteriovoraceae bacterium]
MKNLVEQSAKEFSSQSHGSSDYWQDSVYVLGENEEEYIPLSFLIKNKNEVKDIKDLQSQGYTISSLTYLELDKFDDWYQNVFNRKLTQKAKKSIDIVHLPDAKEIFKAVEIVNQVYRILKDHKVLVNGKNLPVQLGEWYAKIILGLYQKKSTSQRGFDFFTDAGKKVEVKTHWHDITSPKGVKLKKSLIEMSDYTVVMYISKNFMIRDILLLDSDFVLRKFATKGHTIFLKDSDIATYFFSKSSKHYDKIFNKSMLLKFSSPDLALKIDENTKD